MRKLFFILTIFSSLTLLSCSDKLETSKTKPTSAGVATEQSDKKFIYPYTGEVASTDPSTLVPYMTIIENSKSARPQSGLADADIVYETSAEGGIPRFLALFHKNSPAKIGPIRSVRPYFLTFAKEHALPFGHCGGSKDAISEIEKDTALMSINEMKTPKNFFRDADRKAPHNLYTSSSGFINALELKKFNAPSMEFFKYDNNSLKNISETASNINIVANRIYTTDYKFENNKYTKYMDGDVAIDSNTGNPITFSNVLVQKTKITLSSDGNHLDIDLIGDGTGYLFTNGKKIDITWKKISEYSSTKFYDVHGDEIKLAPGNTIINVIDNDSKVNITP